MLVVDDLRKSFGHVRAVDGLSFEVDPGSVFAFLGTNGAGKSTTISCLTTVLMPDSGTAVINGRLVGRDDDAIRADIGVVFQSSLLDPLLTPVENLRLRASFYRLSNPDAVIDRLITLLDLGSFSQRRYGVLSGGEKRRTDIARALVHSPSILFLDEPTAGLDPQSRLKVWKTIAELQDTLGLTVFLTTHYMDETENAHDVLIIDQGRQVACGTPMELRARYARSELSLRVREPDKVTRRISREGLVARDGLNRGELVVTVNDAREALRVIDGVRNQLEDFELRHGTMDQVFLSLTGQRSGHLALAEKGSR